MPQDKPLRMGTKIDKRCINTGSLKPRRPDHQSQLTNPNQLSCKQPGLSQVSFGCTASQSTQANEHNGAATRALGKACSTQNYRPRRSFIALPSVNNAVVPDRGHLRDVSLPSSKLF